MTANTCLSQAQNSENCVFAYLPTFLDRLESNNLFAQLSANETWCRESFKMFGKHYQTPRHTAWVGDVGALYRYTGLDHVGIGWPKYLQSIRDKVQITTGHVFNFAVVNRYDHGCEHMGWHRDDERGAAPVIASLSLGGVRRFRMHEADGSKRSYDLADGSLLVFDGRARHQLAKTQRQVEPRINLTFRSIQSVNS